MDGGKPSSIVHRLSSTCLNWRREVIGTPRTESTRTRHCIIPHHTGIVVRSCMSAWTQEESHDRAKRIGSHVVRAQGDGPRPRLVGVRRVYLCLLFREPGYPGTVHHQPDVLPGRGPDPRHPDQHLLHHFRVHRLRGPHRGHAARGRRLRMANPHPRPRHRLCPGRDGLVVHSLAVGAPVRRHAAPDVLHPCAGHPGRARSGPLVHPDARRTLPLLDHRLRGGHRVCRHGDAPLRAPAKDRLLHLHDRAGVGVPALASW